MDQKTKKQLCETLILSQFTYCDFIYGPCLTQSDKNRIQKIQKSCFRLIYGVRKFQPITYKIKEDRCLFMESRRLQHLGVYTHKLITDAGAPPCLKQKFKRHSNIHSRTTRFNEKFVLPQHRTAMFLRSFTFQSISLYNSLPQNFKIFNINKFKYKLKNLLLSKQ